MATSKNKQVKAEPEVEEKSSSKKTIAIIIGILIVLAGIAYYASTTRDAEDSTAQSTQTTTETEDQSSKNEQAQSEADDAAIEKAKEDAASGNPVETVVVESDSEYRYVAGSGDSYTVLARQAIEKSGSDLTDAERVAAETKLTQDAGAPYLDIGQDVTIKKSVVSAAVSWAKSLSSEQKSAWQYYADQVAW